MLLLSCLCSIQVCKVLQCQPQGHFSVLPVRIPSTRESGMPSTQSNAAPEDCAGIRCTARTTLANPSEKVDLKLPEIWLQCKKIEAVSDHERWLKVILSVHMRGRDALNQGLRRPAVGYPAAPPARASGGLHARARTSFLYSDHRASPGRHLCTNGWKSPATDSTAQCPASTVRGTCTVNPASETLTAGLLNRFLLFLLSTARIFRRGVFRKAVCVDSLPGISSGHFRFMLQHVQTKCQSSSSEEPRKPQNTTMTPKQSKTKPLGHKLRRDLMPVHHEVTEQA